MQQQRLNAYRSMWLIVLYDLPTETAQQRKKAAKFHKDLQSLGFSMFNLACMCVILQVVSTWQ